MIFDCCSSSWAGRGLGGTEMFCLRPTGKCYCGRMPWPPRNLCQRYKHTYTHASSTSKLKAQHKSFQAKKLTFLHFHWNFQEMPFQDNVQWIDVKLPINWNSNCPPLNEFKWRGVFRVHCVIWGWNPVENEWKNESNGICSHQLPVGRVWPFNRWLNNTSLELAATQAHGWSAQFQCFQVISSGCTSN